MSQLTEKWRAKFPGAYDDLDDATLEKSILAKHPEYKDLAEPNADEIIAKAKEPLPSLSDKSKLATEPAKPQSKGMWDTLTSPLTDAPSRFAKSVSNYINPDSTTTGVRGVGSAFIEGIGDTISGFSSPLNLAMAATGAGEAIPAISKAARIGTKLLSAPMVGEGIKHFAEAERPEDYLSAGLETAGGALGLRSRLPAIAESMVKPTNVRSVDPSLFNKFKNLKDIPRDITDALPEYKDSTRRSMSPELYNRYEPTKFGKYTQTEIPRQLDKDIFRSNEEEAAPPKKGARFTPNSSGVSADELVSSPEAKASPFNPNNLKFENAPFKAPEFKNTKPRGMTDVSRAKQIEQPAAAGKSINDVESQVNPETGEEIPQNKPPSIMDESGKLVIGGGKETFGKDVSDILNTPKGILASVNLHAPFRQGMPLINTKAWWTSWDDMLKSYKSEEAYKTVQHSIMSDPNYEHALNSGVKFTDLKDLSTREEVLGSRYADMVPGVKQSNRAYTAFLNKLRMDHFSSLIDKATDAGLDPHNNLPLSNEIGSFINNATGRGSLGGLEKNAQLLNNMLFSPRLIASRIQMMNPLNYTMTQPFVRQQYLKSMLGTIGAWGTMAGVAKLAGADVSLDPSNSDFGKIKIGNTRIDPAAGFQQYIVAAYRLGSGEFTSSGSGKSYELGNKFGGQTRASVAGNFAMSKANPVIKFAYDWANASKKQPFSYSESAAKMFVPIFVQDLTHILSDNPKLLEGFKDIATGDVNPSNLPMAIPASVGMGEQFY